MPGAELLLAPAAPILGSERDATGVCRFQVGSLAELLPESEAERALRFLIAPPGSERPGTFRFAVMSDVQEAIDDVQDIYERLNQEPDVDFLLGAGDLTQQGTREQLERFQLELTASRIPYYTTLGNHELGQTPTLYHEFFGRGNQSFEYRGVRFSLLDSASATIDPTVFEWLEGWLERGVDQLHVVAMHIPPLDPVGVRNGAFASRAEAAKLLGRLAQADVDLTIYGHIHSYYRFDNAGIPAFISGGGGAIPERFDQMRGQGGLIASRLRRAERLAGLAGDGWQVTAHGGARPEPLPCALARDDQRHLRQPAILAQRERDLQRLARIRPEAGLVLSRLHGLALRHTGELHLIVLDHLGD
jgi:predicted phosphodiesterase